RDNCCRRICTPRIYEQSGGGGRVSHKKFTIGTMEVPARPNILVINQKSVVSPQRYHSMKFIVSSSALLKQLQQISGVINANTVLPILEDFLFEIEKNKLTVVAT